MKIYFDNNSTTPVHETVLEAMLPYFRTIYGNPSSNHSIGWRANDALSKAREQVASLVNAEPDQIIFTSGGSESNNMFVRGVASALSVKSGIAAFSSIEHPCIEKPMDDLCNNGWSVKKIKTMSSGTIDLDDVAKVVADSPQIMSLMLANNETGVIQPVKEAMDCCKGKGIWTHTDAVQAVGKLPIDFKDLGVHSMSISAHKIYGPKGVGALVVDRTLPVFPLIKGGGHENGMRSGTENIPAIVGMGRACELAAERTTKLSSDCLGLRDFLEQKLQKLGAIIFGKDENRLTNTTYFALENVSGEMLVMELNKLGIAVSSGSACSSVTKGPSSVLVAMGVEKDLAECAVRVSLGADNTKDQIKYFIEMLESVLNKLRRLSAIAI